MDEGTRPARLVIGEPELRQTRYGGVLRFSYAGHYPPGSEGTPTAQAMFDHTWATLQEHDPEAVGALLFDLTGLDYVWGDGIAVLTLRMWYMSCPPGQRTPPPLRPNAMVAVGRTAAALRSLFDAARLTRITDTRIFEDEADAWEDLTARLSLLHGP